MYDVCMYYVCPGVAKTQLMYPDLLLYTDLIKEKVCPRFLKRARTSLVEPRAVTVDHVTNQVKDWDDMDAYLTQKVKDQYNVKKRNYVKCFIFLSSHLQQNLVLDLKSK